MSKADGRKDCKSCKKRVGSVNTAQSSSFAQVRLHKQQAFISITPHSYGQQQPHPVHNSTGHRDNTDNQDWLDSCAAEQVSKAQIKKEHLPSPSARSRKPRIVPANAVKAALKQYLRMPFLPLPVPAIRRRRSNGQIEFVRSHRSRSRGSPSPQPYEPCSEAEEGKKARYVQDYEDEIRMVSPQTPPYEEYHSSDYYQDPPREQPLYTGIPRGRRRFDSPPHGRRRGRSPSLREPASTADTYDGRPPYDSPPPRYASPAPGSSSFGERYYQGAGTAHEDQSPSHLSHPRSRPTHHDYYDEPMMSGAIQSESCPPYDETEFMSDQKNRQEEEDHYLAVAISENERDNAGRKEYVPKQEETDIARAIHASLTTLSIDDQRRHHPRSRSPTGTPQYRTGPNRISTPSPYAETIEDPDIDRPSTLRHHRRQPRSARRRADDEPPHSSSNIPYERRSSISRPTPSHVSTTSSSRRVQWSDSIATDAPQRQTTRQPSQMHPLVHSRSGWPRWITESRDRMNQLHDLLDELGTVLRSRYPTATELEYGRAEHDGNRFDAIIYVNGDGHLLQEFVVDAVTDDFVGLNRLIGLVSGRQ